MFGLFKKKPEAPLPTIPAGQRLYVIGDIHGRLDSLNGLLDKIAADSQSSTQPARLIFLGDYIDRGVASRGVIDRLLELPSDTVFLMGNHDQVMRAMLNDNNIDLAAKWLAVGGREAALSYGVRAPVQPTPEMLAQFVADLRAAVPQTHRAFLDNLETSYTVGDYFFCHAGVRPGTPLDQQAEDDLCWIRADFINHPGPHDKVVVHGHTVVPQPAVFTHRIGIDTGAYATGNLTALGLEGDRKWFLHTL